MQSVSRGSAGRQHNVSRFHSREVNHTFKAEETNTGRGAPTGLRFRGTGAFRVGHGRIASA